MCRRVVRRTILLGVSAMSIKPRDGFIEGVGVLIPRRGRMVGLAVTCDGLHGVVVAGPEGKHGSFLPPILSEREDGCPACDLREGAGTTHVDQMRPAFGWRCRCLKFRSGESEERNEFRRRADERLSVIASKCWSRWTPSSPLTASPSPEQAAQLSE